MRILKPGNVTKQLYHGECRKCGCEFEEDAGKLNVEHYRDGSFVRVKCPYCTADAFMYPVKS